jgi:RNA polymerase sigma-70 factor, ECF subfamily
MHDARADIGKRLVAILPNMRRFALSLARNGDRADDLVQAACTRALAAATQFQPGTRFDAWMFRIIRNLWIDAGRRERGAGIAEDIDEHPEIADQASQHVAEGRLTLAAVATGIAGLPVEQREVLLLVCVEDLSYKETADVLDIPIGTVMSRLARARRKLAEAAGIEAGTARSPEAWGER